MNNFGERKKKILSRESKKVGPFLIFFLPDFSSLSHQTGPVSLAVDLISTVTDHKGVQFCKNQETMQKNFLFFLDLSESKISMLTKQSIKTISCFFLHCDHCIKNLLLSFRILHWREKNYLFFTIRGGPEK